MRMLKLLWALPLSLATLGAAHARGNDVYWSVDVGSPGLSVGVGNAPRVYAPPVYVAPPRPTVYVQPAPPPVVVYEPPYGGPYYGQPYGGGRYHYWQPTRAEAKSGKSN